jgi:hypothetical protein
MLRQSQKIFAALLALALLLAPVEFVYAHDVEPGPMPMQHQHHAEADHAAAAQGVDSGAHACGSQGGCSLCVYCSPALSHAPQVGIDRPQAPRIAAAAPAYHGIDLPVDIRPPKTL